MASQRQHLYGDHSNALGTLVGCRFERREAPAPSRIKLRLKKWQYACSNHHRKGLLEPIHRESVTAAPVICASATRQASNDAGSSGRSTGMKMASSAPVEASAEQIPRNGPSSGA
jgi:hypothetical protein